jgi:hypothetical protein
MAIMNILVIFISKYSRKIDPKSILDFQKWTKKMSKNEKWRKTFEKMKK